MSGIIGLISVSAATPGASAVQAIAKVTASDSSSRATLLTPASGKKVRVLGWYATNKSTTGGTFDCYFGTGAGLSSDFTKLIFFTRLDDGVDDWAGYAFPDGAGPVGAVDEVVSMTTDVNVSSEGKVGIVFREE